MTPHVISQPSSTPRFLNDTDYRYFELFRNETVSELSGFFDTDIWDRLILQYCHEEAFARQAAIAMGALTRATAEDAQHHEGRVFLEVSARLHYDYALEQYGKALRLMRGIRDQEPSACLRNTLISALLTTCFESFVGNEENAFAQAQAGIDVLAEYRNKIPLDYRDGFIDQDRGYPSF